MAVATVIMAALLVVGAPRGGADVMVMKDITLGFGAALEHCREETGLTEDKMEEFFHFWRKDFKFEHRELGCAITCMSRYFNLLTDSNRLHKLNTETFIKSFPNGEKLALQLIDFIHQCEKKFDTEVDTCMRVLRVAECFKDTCHAQGIAPDMEMLLAEYIMEVDA